MSVFLRRPSSHFILLLMSTLVYILALSFVALRLATPSDGARLALGSSLSAADAAMVDSVIDPANSLRSGDAIMRVGGRVLGEWVPAVFDSSVAGAGWHIGDFVDYEVRRGDETLSIRVPLGRFPIGLLLWQNAPSAIFLTLMQLQALWMWRQRRNVATQTLVVAASAFIAFSLCWYVGMDFAALVSRPGLMLYYRVITIVQLMVMSAALMHFALVLPETNGISRYSQRSIILIYLMPYPLFALFLFLSRTVDPLTWLWRWEFGALALLALAFILTLLALTRGYRRMTDPNVRSRLGVVLLTFGLALSLAMLVGVMPVLLLGEFVLRWEVVPLLSLPVALGLGVSVVFYGLFDLRIVIQRTLVWGTLTLLIISLYVLVVGALSALFQTGGSPVFSLIATGIVAVVFSVVRTRLHHGVNWLLYGERDAPSQVIARLARQLDQALTPVEALNQIAQTAASALKLPYVAIELRQDGGYLPLASWGAAGDEGIEFPLNYGGERVGRLVIAPRSPGEALTPGDHYLLSGLFYHAESAIQAARLMADLQRSREKLVTAREEERRRLRRDLHDGLGPALASLILQIDAARNHLKTDPARAAPLLLDIKTQISSALADIRRLVYELRPPVLDQLGLSAAIREKARELERTSGLTIRVELPETLPPLSAAAEVALYRIYMEALTNVIRHSRAKNCIVRLSCNGTLRLEVSDDGDGLPGELQRGVGLNSMIERASELGGSCEVTRGPSGGTRVLAQLPLHILPQLERMP